MIEAIMENYENLALAVVTIAIQDYKDIISNLKVAPDNKKYRKEFELIKQDFRSKNFQALLAALDCTDSEYLMRLINRISI
jgi:hypothetical protein